MLNMRKKAKPFKDVSKEDLTDYYLHKIFVDKETPGWYIVWHVFVDYINSKAGNPEYKYYSYDNEDIDSAKKDPKFMQWLKEIYIPERMDESLEDLSSVKFYEDYARPIPIYRAMFVGDNYIKFLSEHGKHLGIYWSDSLSNAGVAMSVSERYKDRPEALNFMQVGNVDRMDMIYIESMVEPKYVDWHQTVYTRSRHLGYPIEQEITLFKGTPLQIKAIYSRNKVALDITPIKGMTFYA